MSWWDYGYQIAGMADRATVVDNNTWNNTHIALVGKFMASDEKKAHALATQLGLFNLKVSQNCSSQKYYFEPNTRPFY